MLKVVACNKLSLHPQQGELGLCYCAYDYKAALLNDTILAGGPCRIGEAYDM